MKCCDIQSLCAAAWLGPAWKLTTSVESGQGEYSNVSVRVLLTVASRHATWTDVKGLQWWQRVHRLDMPPVSSGKKLLFQGTSGKKARAEEND